MKFIRAYNAGIGKINKNGEVNKNVNNKYNDLHNFDDEHKISFYYGFLHDHLIIMGKIDDFLTPVSI